MSKHRDRRREEPQYQQRPQNNFNTNPLMQMLGNIDINQLTSLLGSLNTNGLNLNNLNLNDLKPKVQQGDSRDIVATDDTVALLNSLKPFVDPKKTQLIDKIIDLYLSGEFDD